MGNKGAISGAVLNYFKQYPNQNVSVTEVMEATNLARPQVMNAFTSLRSRRIAVVPVISGEYYRYIPDGFDAPAPAPVAPAPAPAAPTGNGGKTFRVFEELGAMRDGTLILRSEEGTIYKAEEL